MKLSAIILNHDRLPQNTIKSVAFCDETLIIQDGNLLDPKPRNKKVKIISHHLNHDFSAQRNFAINQATGDWLLFVDSDEEISHSLAQEIKARIFRTNLSGFYIKRTDFFYGRPLKYGETGNTYLLRLAKKKSGCFSRSVHETWQIDGKTGRIDQPILHSHSQLVEPFINKMTLYSLIDAQSLDRESKPFSFFRMLFLPKAKFIYNYILRLGFLDGYLGLFHAYLMAVQSLTVRITQWCQEK